MQIAIVKPRTVETGLSNRRRFRITRRRPPRQWLLPGKLRRETDHLELADQGSSRTSASLSGRSGSRAWCLNGVVRRPPTLFVGSNAGRTFLDVAGLSLDAAPNQRRARRGGRAGPCGLAQVRLALDLLGHLVDKSLVIAEGQPEPRYRLLDTTRAFALEQLASAGESETMLERHAQSMYTLLAPIDANCWNLSPGERTRAVHELANVRAAVEWATAAAHQDALRYELLSKCWLVWMHNGAIREGVARMMKFWPPSPHLPKRLLADFCLALARLNGGCATEEQWHAARRAEGLYREEGDRERLGDALLLLGTIGPSLRRLSEAEQALREAESLIDAETPLRKQAALASTQGEHYMCQGAFDRAIEAFRRQQDLYRRAGAELGQYLALANVGSSQLQAGDVDTAIDSLRQAVEGLRRVNAPYGTAYHVGMLALALALRGDDDDVPRLASEAFEELRSFASTSCAFLAAALYHANRDDVHRAIVIGSYTLSGPARRNAEPLRLHAQLHQRICRHCLRRRFDELTASSQYGSVSRASPLTSSDNE